MRDDAHKVHFICAFLRYPRSESRGALCSAVCDIHDTPTRSYRWR